MLNSIGLFGKSFAFGAPAASIFGDGTAYGNITGTASYNAGTGTWTVTGAATVDIQAETDAAVLLCRNVVVDGPSAVLTVTTNCKGLLLFASESYQEINGGRTNIDYKGKAGNFGDLTPYDLVPAAWRGGLDQAGLDAYVFQGEGAAGAAAQTSVNTQGITGAAATAMQTGGGGSSTYNGNGYACPPGGKGGPCCGGAGAAANNGYGVTTFPGDYGGPGGSSYPTVYNASGGGAGDPVGVGQGGGPNGLGAGGGILAVFSPSISIASGCIASADGALGGGNTMYSGGSAGGGNVLMVTLTGGLSNAGTIRAAGGGNAGSNIKGGAGGVGSVNTFTV